MTDKIKAWEKDLNQEIDLFFLEIPDKINELEHLLHYEIEYANSTDCVVTLEYYYFKKRVYLATLPKAAQKAFKALPELKFLSKEDEGLLDPLLSGKTVELGKIKTGIFHIIDAIFQRYPKWIPFLTEWVFQGIKYTEPPWTYPEPPQGLPINASTFPTDVIHTESRFKMTSIDYLEKWISGKLITGDVVGAEDCIRILK